MPLPQAVQALTNERGVRHPAEAVRQIAAELLDRAGQTRPRFSLQPLLELAPVPLHPAIQIHKMLYGGSLTCEDGAYRIAVNAADSRVRQRFSVAHELGHAFFVPYSDENRYRLPGMAHNVGLEERLCNIFATNVLMPEAPFTADMGHHVDAASLMALSKAYDVSLLSTIIRASELGNSTLVAGFLSSPDGTGRSQEINRLTSRTSERRPIIWKALLGKPFQGEDGKPACLADIFWSDGHVSREVRCHPVDGRWLYVATMRPG